MLFFSLTFFSFHVTQESGFSNDVIFRLKDLQYKYGTWHNCKVGSREYNMTLSPVDNARNIADATYGIPNAALRHRIMDYLASTHNASYDGTSDIAYGWPCEAEEITVLHAEYLGLEDEATGWVLQGLNWLKGLKELYLDGNEGIQKLRPLSTEVNNARSPLLQLEILSLNGCRCIINQGEPIHTLHALKYLDMSGCAGTTLSPFNNLHKTLYDPEPLEDPHGYLLMLETLILSNCSELTDISDVSGLTGLKKLDISGCTQITDLDPVITLRYNNHFVNGELNISGIPHTDGILADIATLQGYEDIDIIDDPNFVVVDYDPCTVE